jgi:hypothetical protein
MRRWMLAVAVCVALAVGVLAAAGAEDPGSSGARPSPDMVADATSAPEVPGGAAADTPTATSTPAQPRSAATSPASDGVLVIWARGDLTPDVAEDVATLPEVVAAAHVRSETLGVVGSTAADGTAVEDLPGDYRIPVTVSAVDPTAYAATLPIGPARAAILDLSPGEALLTETGSRLRGVGVGGRIDLASLSGLDVIAVVPDILVGSAEIVLHIADADEAGLDEDGTIHLVHDAAAGPRTAALVEELTDLLPDDVTARVVNVATGQPRRRAPLVLSLAQVKDRFGEFAFRPREGVREIDVDAEFRETHIVTADVPILGRVTCHREIFGDLRGALQDIVDAELDDEIDPDRYAGCYYPRLIAASGDRLSRHSWGIALDINVDVNLPNLGPPPHPLVVAAFEAHGFRWGGEFLQPDNHHFEWVGRVE